MVTFIQCWQDTKDGEGMGITCAHLNLNIEHPEKPKGKKSERLFTEMLRRMPSIVESKELWQGKAVFKLKVPISEASE